MIIIWDIYIENNHYLFTLIVLYYIYHLSSTLNTDDNKSDPVISISQFLMVHATKNSYSHFIIYDEFARK